MLMEQPAQAGCFLSGCRTFLVDLKIDVLNSYSSKGVTNRQEYDELKVDAHDRGIQKI